MRQNGAEKLFSRMNDREYAEMADLPEDMLYEEIILEEILVDEEKDKDYFVFSRDNSDFFCFCCAGLCRRRCGKCN